MKYGCCTTMDYYDKLDELGFDYIELAGKSIVAMDSREFYDTANKISAGRVKCNGLNAYCPQEIVIAGPNFNKDNAEKYALHVMRRAKELGVSAVGIGSPNSRILPEGYDRVLAKKQIKEFIEVTAAIAEKYDIELLLEAVCTRECNYINTTNEALELTEELALPNLKMVYDIYHAMMMGEDTHPLKEAFRYIRHMHICQDIDGKRCYLWEQGREEYKKYIHAAINMGYDRVISLEAFSGDVAKGAEVSLEILKSIERESIL